VTARLTTAGAAVGFGQGSLAGDHQNLRSLLKVQTHHRTSGGGTTTLPPPLAPPTAAAASPSLSLPASAVTLSGGVPHAPRPARRARWLARRYTVTSSASAARWECPPSPSSLPPPSRSPPPPSCSPRPRTSGTRHRSLRPRVTRAAAAAVAAAILLPGAAEPEAAGGAAEAETSLRMLTVTS